jgi:hypothetical protein
VGAVTFGASPLACDLVHASLLRLDARCIPLLREATGRFRWPLAQESFVPEVVMNGERTTLEGLARRFGVDAKVPAGWRSQLEWASVRNHPALTA